MNPTISTKYNYYKNNRNSNTLASDLSKAILSSK
jgi:hypothetical protein